jgi:putative copper export protein
MSGSYSFLLHLMAFGMLAGTLIPSFILDRKLRAEQDWGRKLYIGGIMRTFGTFAPFNVAFLLITGIGNIHNRLLGAPYSWYEEGWLVAKVICFAVMAANGLLLAPKISKNRMMLIKAIFDKKAPADAEQQLANYNRKLSVFFLVQTALLLAILFLSAFGSAKHPGQF